MYEDLTAESIKSDLIGRLSTDINVNEGSYTNDMISAVAYEIWKGYQSLDALIPIAFVDETSGEYIDRRCAEYGITRKAGTAAKATLNFTGTDGTLIPAGKVFLTVEGLQFETDETVTITAGVAMVNATAVEIGEEYNVDVGTITQQLISLGGLSTVTNEKATGGTDPESDTDLVKRLNDYLRSPATSGNVAHYKQWALSVNGVGAVKVEPLWNGPGTVKVLIVNNEKKPVDSTILNNCAECIESNRPIGATVTVESAQELSVDITAKIIIDSSTTLDTVRTEFEASLKSYLKDISFEKYTIVYNRIVYMLLDISGVMDYTSLTINGGTANITIADNKVPVLQNVEVIT
ncbi:baseplate J/gp47 family protein [Ruminiclostridium josui]|uniref:baseplate J/gp47 family protein n=1 Tax=Ruminiclostridium josui TaxID=1499 RepID=UPI00046660D2|nr:baseplate J/gp47 family protein [Ruminiclostridium josui]